MIKIFGLIWGLTLCILGASLLIRGSSNLALRFGFSPLAVGLTVVAFGTSLPELMVSAQTSWEGHSTLALGNVLGSNIMNIFLILSLSTIIYPISVQTKTVKYEIPFLFAISVLFFGISADSFFNPKSLNMISRIDSFILLILFIVFLLYVFFNLNSEKKKGFEAFDKPKIYLLILFIVGGLFFLVYGGHKTVSSASQLAHFLGLSEKWIGAVLVALGTSLPELVTSIYAAVKKQLDLAVGNIVGSNLFNLLLIGGVSGLIQPIPIEVGFYPDAAMGILGSFLVFLAMFTGGRNKLDRWEAIGLLIIFLLFQIFNFNNDQTPLEIAHTL